MDWKRFIKELTKSIITMIILFSIVAGLAFVGSTVQNDLNERIYNHGICTECGANYKFISIAVSGSGSCKTHYYYYKCERCDKIIELQK